MSSRRWLSGTRSTPEHSLRGWQNPGVHRQGERPMTEPRPADAAGELVPVSGQDQGEPARGAAPQRPASELASPAVDLIPATIADAGEGATYRFFEFFTAGI